MWGRTYEPCNSHLCAYQLDDVNHVVPCNEFINTLCYLCNRVRCCMKSVQILKIGCLLGESADMLLSQQSKVPKLLQFCHQFLLDEICSGLQVPFPFSVILDRFKNSHLSIMCAVGSWLCPPSSTWATRCWWVKYKLQSSWAPSGLCHASSSQLLLLHSSLIVISWCIPVILEMVG